MMKGALLGFGAEAENAYTPALKDPSCPLAITAAADGTEGGRAAAARAFPEARIYSGAEELLAAEKGLEFAIAAGPAAGRPAGLKLALAAGLHAATHPPFCASSAEFEELRQAAARAGRTLFCAQPWERSVPYSSLSRLVTDGALGPVRHAEVTILTTRPAGRGKAGGVTAALGWQAFSILLGLVRLPPTAMTARLGQAFPYDEGSQEAAADLQVHFTGASGTVRLEAGAYAARFRAAVTGENGGAELSGGRLTVELRGRAAETFDFDEKLDAGLSRPGWLLEELKAFDAEAADPARRGAGLKNSGFCARLLKNAYYSAGLRSAAVPL